MSANIEIVWLHGFTGGPGSWSEVAAGLGGWRPWLLGHGPRPSLAATSFAAEVDRLEGLARRRGGQPRLLVGYSMGARVGLGWLARHPQRFMAAVLVGVHPGLPEGEAGEALRLERAAADSEWLKLLKNHSLAEFLAAWAGRDIFASQAKADPARLAQQWRLRSGHEAAGLARALEVLGLAAMPDYHAAVAAWDRPLTLVAGAEDGRFGALASELAASARRGRLVTLASCGHNPLIEAPHALRAVVEQMLEDRTRG